MQKIPVQIDIKLDFFHLIPIGGRTVCLPKLDFIVQSFKVR